MHRFRAVAALKANVPHGLGYSQRGAQLVRRFSTVQQPTNDSASPANQQQQQQPPPPPPQDQARPSVSELESKLLLSLRAISKARASGAPTITTNEPKKPFDSARRAEDKPNIVGNSVPAKVSPTGPRIWDPQRDDTRYVKRNIKAIRQLLNNLKAKARPPVSQIVHVLKNSSPIVPEVESIVDAVFETKQMDQSIALAAANVYARVGLFDKLDALLARCKIDVNSVESKTLYMNAHTQAGNTDKAMELFNEIPSDQRNDIQHNIILKIYRDKNDIDATLAHIKIMEADGVGLTAASLRLMLFLFEKFSRIPEFVALALEHMKKNQIWLHPDENMMLLTACATSGQLTLAGDYFNYIASIAPMTIDMYVSMITMYAKYGRVKQAEELWQSMFRVGWQQNAATWSAILKVYAQTSQLDKIKEVIQDLMPAHDAKPLMRDYELIIPIFGSRGMYDETLHYLNAACKLETALFLAPNVVTDAVVHLAAGGRHHDVLKTITEPHSFIYEAVLRGYAMVRDSEAILALCDRMAKDKLQIRGRPDFFDFALKNFLDYLLLDQAFAIAKALNKISVEATKKSLITLLDRSYKKGAYELAHELFEWMTQLDFDHKTNMDFYNIQLISNIRTGRLKESSDIFDNMVKKAISVHAANASELLNAYAVMAAQGSKKDAEEADRIYRICRGTLKLDIAPPNKSRTADLPLWKYHHRTGRAV